MSASPRALAVFAALLALLASASAPALAAIGEISAQAATKIVEGCAAHAKARRQSHAIVVHDEGGHLVAALRMDGNPPGTTEFAMRKALAVAHWRFSTAEMDAAAKETPGFRDAPHVVTVAGGIPVFSADGNQFVGAVGVSGEAPADDLACAVAGVKAAGLSPSSKPAS